MNTDSTISSENVEAFNAHFNLTAFHFPVRAGRVVVGHINLPESVFAKVALDRGFAVSFSESQSGERLMVVQRPATQHEKSLFLFLQQHKWFPFSTEPTPA